MTKHGDRRGSRRTRSLAGLLAAVLAVTVAGLVWSVPAWAATAALRGVGSGRCLDVSGASSTNGSRLELWDCTGAADQQWSYDPATQRVVVYGNKCLDASGHGTTAGTAVIIWDCTGGANQQWTLGLDGTVVGVESGLCLDATGAATANGTVIELWTCNRGTGQQWTTSALTPPSASCPSAGHVTYTLTRATTPTTAQTEAYNRITAAMDQAVAVYNCYTGIAKAITVQYDPSVPTADASYNGTLRFGATSSMQQITAMHEVGHTVGVGTYGAWAGLVSGGHWTGAAAIAELRSLTGDPTAVIGADSQHFWPYGLNYTSEVTSAQDLVRHCLMVVALRQDMGL